MNILYKGIDYEDMYLLNFTLEKVPGTFLKKWAGGGDERIDELFKEKLTESRRVKSN
ncbi:MAG TPA: hypothetical protein VJB34_03190 [Bdellovibrionota bacterium]|nr:hypothetical protein [Bdellovibrionota bacterium]